MWPFPRPFRRLACEASFKSRAIRAHSGVADASLVAAVRGVCTTVLCRQSNSDHAEFVDRLSELFRTIYSTCCIYERTTISAR